MNTLLTLIVSIGIALSTFSAYEVTHLTHAPVQSVGSFNPSGGQTYRLQTSIGTSDTSINLSSFKEPVSNIPLTMTYLNTSIGYGTLDPQNSSRKEFISFTGVTQNSDGTAQLTGVTRGLGFSYPFTASSTLKNSHAGQSIFILSDSPQLFNEYYVLRNTATSTGVLVFSSTTPPRYDYTAAQAGGTYIATTSELASVAYVNAVAVAGAANGTASVKGIYQSSTGAQAAAGTALGGTGASLALTSSISSSTPSSPQSVSANTVVTSGATGFLAQAWQDLTALWTYTGGLSSTGTTTISASNINTNPLKINTVAYQWPSSQGSASTFLSNNGSGTLSWATPSIARYTLSFGSATANNGFATTTSKIVIPAGVLTASSTIQFMALVQSTQGSNTSGTFFLSDSAGTIFMTCSISDTAAAGGYNYAINGMIFNNSSLSAQSQYDTFTAQNTSSNAASVGSCGGTNTTFNTANALSLVGVMSSPNATNFSLSSMVITVNP